MPSLSTLLRTNVYPFFCCPVKHENYFKYFCLTFLFLDSLTFLTSFVIGIVSLNPLSFFTLFFRALLVGALYKVYFDYRKDKEYGNKFAHFYSIFRLGYVIFTLSILLLRSIFLGAFKVLFFPLHHHRMRFILNGFVGFLIFVGLICYSVYLNLMFFHVIKVKMEEKGQKGKAPLDEVQSEASEGKAIEP